MVGKPHPDPEGLFWSHVDRSAGPDHCWPWTRYIARNGYGQSKYQGVSQKAHRVAFRIANGWLPTGRERGSIIIRHRCDNPRCCNPAHLETGTHADNVRDMDERGRRVPHAMHGSLNPAFKLTPAMRLQIQKLRRDGISQDAIALRVGVGQSTVSRLLRGETFKGAWALDRIEEMGR